MKEYVWLFPIIFMFHDMEEIIGFKFFLRQNGVDLEKRFPFILKRYKDFSTEGFALAVYEELILCIAISALAYFIDRNFLWYLWLGASSGTDGEIAGETITVGGDWDAPLSAVTLRCEKRILSVGEKAKLTPTLTLMDARRIETEDARIESSDERILKVEKGVVTALEPGLCLVKMSMERSGVRKECRLPFLVR